ncbi:hypothetical protein BDR22DRAFT_862396 [Usnea florida]
MNSRLASNAARLMPISSSSLRIVRHNALSSAERLSTVWSEIIEDSLLPWRYSFIKSSSFDSTLDSDVLIKVFNMVVLEISRDRMSAMSSCLHFIRSHVRLLLVPRLLYFSTRLCKSARTFSHPSLITISLSALAVFRGRRKRISSLSFSTACKDNTSVLIFSKLSGAALPTHFLNGWYPGRVLNSQDL